jgi:transitional endoplasmic reticulum ATPase
MKMSSNRLEQSLRLAKEHFQRALTAKNTQDFEEAHRLFLVAAENLLIAASLSPPLLQTSRKALAEQLIAEAQSLGKSQRLTRIERKQAHAESGEENDLEIPWLIRERPGVRFADVAGLEEVKEQIRLKLLYPFTHPELAETYGIQAGGGLLLYGPPGTGKTLIARAIAGEIEAAFFAIKPSEIMSQWVGVAEQNLARLFREARQYPLSVIFIDEMEALAPRRRGSASTVMVRVVPQLLAELDGFEKSTNPVLVIGATNEPWAIDHAILRPGRLDRLIYVPPPDFSARLKILKMNLKEDLLAPECDLADFARRTEGFSGADMTAMAQRVRELAFTQAVASGQPRLISAQDFEEVLGDMRPSIQAKDLALYEKFAQDGRNVL